MSITPIYFAAELTDGQIIGPIRITAADKIRAEQTGRNQRWEWADNPRMHSLMGFFAAKRSGEISHDSYTAFMEDLVDFSISNKTSDEDEDEDPTQADTSSS